MVYEYKIARGTELWDFEENIDALEANVNELIKAGWEPYGNVFSNGAFVYQPMICRKAKEKLLERERVSYLEEKTFESNEKSDKKSRPGKEWLIER